MFSWMLMRMTQQYAPSMERVCSNQDTMIMTVSHHLHCHSDFNKEATHSLTHLLTCRSCLQTSSFVCKVSTCLQQCRCHHNHFTEAQAATN